MTPDQEQPAGDLAACPECWDASFRGFKRGRRCLTCDGSGYVAAASPAPTPAEPDARIYWHANRGWQVEWLTAQPNGGQSNYYRAVAAPTPADAASPEPLTAKARRVREMVDAGPYPGMSEAFDAHMGASCWVDPCYAPDASTWAAAWKAALRQAEPQQTEQGEREAFEAWYAREPHYPPANHWQREAAQAVKDAALEGWQARARQASTPAAVPVSGETTRAFAMVVVHFCALLGAVIAADAGWY